MAGGKIYLATGKRRKKKMATKSLGKQVKSIKKYIRNIVEKKHHDTVLSDNFGTDAIAGNLCLMAQGDSSANRSGLSVYAKSLWFNYSVQWKTTSTQETQCRMIVFVDKQSNGALPTIAELMDTGNGVNSLYDNINEGHRFVVLHDKLHHNPFPDTTASVTKPFSVRIPVNRRMRFLDGTQTATALGGNMLYFICIGDTVSADADAASMTGHSRLYFDDA